MLNLKVHYEGGLGNQLFQFNFAHLLSKKFDCKVGMIRANTATRSDRPFEIDDLIISSPNLNGISSYGKIKQLFYFRGGNRLKYFRLLLTKFHMLPNLIFEHNPFDSKTRFDILNSTTNVFYGYFQHHKFVEEHFELYSDLLLAKIEKVLNNCQLELAPCYNAIHIRQGDNHKPENLGMGMLSYEYYLNEMKKFDDSFPTYVFTDDKQNALKLCEKLNLSVIFGELDTSPWEALAIMSKAENLIAANSTLSWWSAFIANKRGKTVTIPYPWFRNWQPNPREAFNFKSANIATTKFI